MEIYYSNMSSVTFNEKEIPPINILESYFSIKKINNYHYMKYLFLDSGAFSVYNSKKEEINLNSYIDFIFKNQKDIYVYASLDVIGNGKRTYDNYIEMKKVGLNPIPCFHCGENKNYLFKYADYTDYIALGKLAFVNKKNRVSFLEEIFTYFPDNKKIGFHGFGINDEDILLNYPWKSVDSSSVHMLARYGAIYSPFGILYINPKVSLYLKWRNKESLKILKNYIKKIGCDYEIAIQQDKDGIKERCKISIHYTEELKNRSISFYKKNPLLLF